MSNHQNHQTKIIWRLVSAGCIIFVGCLILATLGSFLLKRICLTSSIYNALGATDLDQRISQLKICSIYLMIVAILGCLGILYNNKNLLHLFALTIFVNIFICLFVLSLLSGLSSHANANLVSTLTEAQKQYDWSDDNKENNSTQLLDDLQWGLHCCGLNEPEDWLPHYLNKTKEDDSVRAYPKSCCIRTMQKRKDGILYCVRPDPDLKGCLDGIPDGHIMILLVIFVMVLVLSLPLTVVAWLTIIREHNGCHHPPTLE